MRKYQIAILAIALLLPFLIVSSLAHNSTKKEKSTVTGKSVTSGTKPVPGQETRVTPVASKAVGFAISAPLRDMPDPAPQRNTSISVQDEGAEINTENSEEIKHVTNWAQGSQDPVIQSNRSGSKDSNAPALAMPTPTLTFEGMTSQNNLNATGGSTVMPPDTEGDGGPK